MKLDEKNKHSSRYVIGIIGTDPLSLRELGGLSISFGISVLLDVLGR